MPRIAALAALLAGLALAACKGGGPSAPPQGAAPAAAPAAASSAFVTTTTVVRREPTDAPRVKRAGGKQASNYVATLQRGEQVAVLAPGDDWTRVRTSDDAEGFVRSAAVLQGDGIVPATVLAPADVFDRPDLLAANARRKLDPGALLLVVRNRPPFSEVNVPGGANAWVLTERLATDDRDVSVAKLAERARALVRANKQDEAKQLLQLARAQFPGAPLVDVLAQELGEAPPPGAPAVPGAAPGTPGAAATPGAPAAPGAQAPAATPAPVPASGTSP